MILGLPPSPQTMFINACQDKKRESQAALPAATLGNASGPEASGGAQRHPNKSCSQEVLRPVPPTLKEDGPGHPEIFQTGFQEGAETAQGRPQTAQESPNTDEKGRKRPPGGPETRTYRSNAPKMAPRRPTRLPTRPKGTPKSLIVLRFLMDFRHPTRAPRRPTRAPRRPRDALPRARGGARDGALAQGGPGALPWRWGPCKVARRRPWIARNGVSRQRTRPMTARDHPRIGP